MKINILTLFPEMLSPLYGSMIGRAIENKILEIDIADIRDHTEDKHNRVDDAPYGGGAGMVMQVQPILDACEAKGYAGEFIYMSPRGEVLSGDLARELSQRDELTILCGHYEGVDQRALDMLGAREISIGDYVLTCGEIPAMVLIDTVARFVDGVLPKEESVMDESIYSGLLEYPHYSRPADYKGMKVPEVLLSGDHKAVDLWRWERSLELTLERRPDLFEKYISAEHDFSKEEKEILESFIQKHKIW